MEELYPRKTKLCEWLHLSSHVRCPVSVRGNPKHKVGVHPLIQDFCFCFFKIIENDLRSQVVEDTLGKHSKLLKLNRPRLLFRHLKGDICKRISFKDSLPCPRTCASSDSLVVSKCPSLKLRPSHQIRPLPSSSPSLKSHRSVTTWRGFTSLQVKNLY